jgi:ferredoxin-NADP reductase
LQEEAEISVRVVDRYHASSTVLAVVAAAAEGGPLPDWQPGAHADFLLPHGIIRQYSLCGDRRDRSHWRFGVLREENGRGGSAFIHDALQMNDVFSLRGPRNNFRYIPAVRYRFIAGGIGITPLLPMLHAAAADGVPWRLFYGARSRAAMAFTDELAQFGGQVVLRPQDQCGILDLDDILAGLEIGDRVYCCGPEPLIAAVEDRFKRGLAGTLHVERFKTTADLSLSNLPLTVTLRRSQKTISVGANESILEAIERAGISPPFSCREGTCGTCETAILGGKPLHRDVVLSEAEKASGKTMMICVSRSSDALLELDL